MKRSQHLAQLQNASLQDIQKEIAELQKKIQDEYLALRFGKTKAVRTLRNLKRELARSLTVANNRARTQVSEEK